VVGLWAVGIWVLGAGGVGMGALRGGAEGSAEGGAGTTAQHVLGPPRRMEFLAPVVPADYKGPRPGMKPDELKEAASHQLDRHGNTPRTAEFIYKRLEPRGEVVEAGPVQCGAHWDIDGEANPGPADDPEAATRARWVRRCGGPVKHTLDIAWVVSLFNDGSYLDGAAVLAKSIRDTHGPHESPHRHHLVALVTEEVVRGASARKLEALGFRLVQRDSPLEASEIRQDFLREKIVKDGCCGITELMKLYAFTLTDYDQVVHLDTDSMVAQNMDELWYHEESMLYTSDYGMATGRPSVPPVQGGFFVVKPSLTVFDALVETVREGHYTQGRGWGDRNTGRFYGGMTIQGLLPYFYAFRAPPEASIELDRCIYNNMVENPRCKEISPALIKNAHFTTCQKPWNCPRSHVQPNCEFLHGVWRGYRYNLAKDLGLGVDVLDGCPEKGPYVPLEGVKDK